jgi:hypothetical protein
MSKVSEILSQELSKSDTSTVPRRGNPNRQGR